MPEMIENYVVDEHVVRDKQQVFFTGSWRLALWKEQNRSHQCIVSGKWECTSPKLYWGKLEESEWQGESSTGAVHAVLIQER